MNIARTCPTCGQTLHLTPWLDEGSGEIILEDGERRTITPSELAILVDLRHRGKAFTSAERLFQSVWGDRLDPPSIAILKTVVCNLRKKLAGTGYEIQHRYGLGYRLAPALED